jgi:hypothetical protein
MIIKICGECKQHHFKLSDKQLAEHRDGLERLICNECFVQLLKENGEIEEVCDIEDLPA